MVDPIEGVEEAAAPGATQSLAGSPTSASAPEPSSTPVTANTSPAWAQRLRRQQMMVQGATLAANSLRSSDHGGGNAHINLEDRS